MSGGGRAGEGYDVGRRAEQLFDLLRAKFGDNRFVGSHNFHARAAFTQDARDQISGHARAIRKAFPFNLWPSKTSSRPSARYAFGMKSTFTPVLANSAAVAGPMAPMVSPFKSRTSRPHADSRRRKFLAPLAEVTRRY